MLRVTLRGVRSHRLRFLLTAVAVMLGVSLVSGTYVLTDSLNNTFNSIVDQASVGTDVQVRGAASDTKTFDGTALRAPLPLTLADQLKQIDGVSRAVPDLQGNAVLVGKDGTAVRSGGAPTFGFAFRSDDPVIKLVKGRGPENKSEIAVESATLKSSDLQVGAQTQALGELTFPIIREHVEDMLAVSDAALTEALRFFAERMKIVVEPTGCLGFAAARKMKDSLRGKRIGVLVSGGNIDLGRFASLIGA
jgi:hypothetical protein